MRRFKVLQKLVEQQRQKAEWKDWDFVVEIEQRAEDANPAIRAGYWSWVEIDWGDGKGTQRYNTLNNASGSIRYNGTLEPGTYQIKIRCNPAATHNNRYLKFGPDASSNGSGLYLKNTYCPQLKKVLKADLNHQKSMDHMFNKCYRLEEVCPFKNTHNILGLYLTFSCCKSLRGTVVFDNLENCTSLVDTFWNAQNLDRALLGPLPKCISMQNTFSKSGVREVVLSDLRNCTSMNSTFMNTKNLKKLVIPGGLPKVTLINAMCLCSAVEEVDIGTELPNCKTFNQAFDECENLRDLHGLRSFPAATQLYFMFNMAKHLEEIELDLGEDVTNLATMFCRCQNLRKLVLRGGFANLTAMNDFVGLCQNLEEIWVNGKLNEFPDLPSVTNMNASFRGTKLKSMKIGNMPELQICTNLLTDCFFLEDLELGDIGYIHEDTQAHKAGGTNAQSLCQNCFNLKHFKVGDNDLTNISYAFAFCLSLEEVEFGDVGFTSEQGHDNDGLINTTQTFGRCGSLRRAKGCLRLRKSGPTNSTAFNNMFQNCLSLETLPDIFWDDGFADTFHYPAAQFQSVFEDCMSLSGTVPTWLWDADDPRRWKGTGVKTNAFKGCFQLENYDDIPNTWKGNLDL